MLLQGTYKYNNVQRVCLHQFSAAFYSLNLTRSATSKHSPMEVQNSLASLTVTECTSAPETKSLADSRPQSALFSPSSSKASSTSTLVGDYEPVKPPSLSTFRLLLAHFGSVSVPLFSLDAELTKMF